MRYPIRWSVAALGCLLGCGAIYAQGTLADYQRGQALAEKSRGLVVDVPGPANWIGETDHFWYAKTVQGGTEFVLVDAGAATKKAAFDHSKLAAAISSASGKTYTALTLPFAPPTGGRGGAGGRGAAAATSSPLTFIDGERGIRFGSGGLMWKCTLTDYACAKEGAIPAVAPGGRGGRGGAPEATLPHGHGPDWSGLAGESACPTTAHTRRDCFTASHGRGSDEEADSPEMVGGDPADGLEYEPPQPGAGQGGRGGRGPSGCATRASAEAQLCGSFDGKWEALIENFNVFLRPTGSKEPPTPLSFDGSEGNYYTLRSIAWSPDSRKLVAYHTRPGYDRQVHYIESSPADQVQPKHTTHSVPQAGRRAGYRVSGAVRRGHEEGDRRSTTRCFPMPYDLTPPVWWKDSRGFTFEYNQRGHQVYRVIEVDAQTGKARALIDEISPTFIDYNLLAEGLSEPAEGTATT